MDGINPHLVSIGDYSVLGVQAAILTHGPIGGEGPAALEAYVWVGFSALILPGVRVGHHSIVGAGAVVTRSVPPRSVVAGNPARVLRELTDAEADRLEQQLVSGNPIGQTLVPADSPDLKRR